LQPLPDAAAAVAWLRARVPAGGRLRTDSRAVQRGDAFIAWPGAATDGRRFAADALAAGAAACLVEREGAEAFAFDDARIAALPGLKAATGAIAHEWFGRPSEQLDLVASTGTNGKTSTAWWTAQSLTSLNRRAGFVGTLGVGAPGAVQPTGLTTPDPVTLHATLAEFVARGFVACAMEASSIGLVERRLDATRIRTALFTNFTRDHLDYHGTMEAYWAAKRTLFDWPGLEAAVVNVDDEKGAALALELPARLDVWTVALRHGARLAAGPLRYEGEGIAFDVREGAATAVLRTHLVGDYNANNLLVVLGALRSLGVPLAEAAHAASSVTPVPGRMQRLGAGGIEVVVDYAHTPDALAQVLAALRPLARARRGRLVCLFGAGGNRDATKRPLMGAAAARAADRVIVTSDNPRHEEPAAIIAQILAGVPERGGVVVIENRAEAIATAIAEAAPGDVVLLAGKGHEDYQEVAGARQPFSDLAEAERALRARTAQAGASA
jgi:UDP-N-acetylmuramoyl-L-alanyl-D-glutamate--2,6-diaminopimelate ligase